MEKRKLTIFILKLKNLAKNSYQNVISINDDVAIVRRAIPSPVTFCQTHHHLILENYFKLKLFDISNKYIPFE